MKHLGYLRREHGDAGKMEGRRHLQSGGLLVLARGGRLDGDGGHDCEFADSNVVIASGVVSVPTMRVGWRTEVIEMEAGYSSRQDNTESLAGPLGAESRWMQATSYLGGWHSASIHCIHFAEVLRSGEMTSLGYALSIGPANQSHGPGGRQQRPRERCRSPGRSPKLAVEKRARPMQLRMGPV